jgi:hypothetical protein
MDRDRLVLIPATEGATAHKRKRRCAVPEVVEPPAANNPSGPTPREEKTATG